MSGGGAAQVEDRIRQEQEDTLLKKHLRKAQKNFTSKKKGSNFVTAFKISNEA